MIYRFFIKFGITTVIIGFCITLVGFFMNGEIGKIAVSNQYIVYQTSFDQVHLMDLPDWLT